MDVATAYLQTPIDVETYMRLPKGMAYKGHDPGKEDYLIVRVNKSIYGFKQWNEEIDAWIKSQGFQASKADPCVYFKGKLDSTEGLIIVGLYVDDLPTTILPASSRRCSASRGPSHVASTSKIKASLRLCWAWRSGATGRRAPSRSASVVIFWRSLSASEEPKMSSVIEDLTFLCKEAAQA